MAKNQQIEACSYCGVSVGPDAYAIQTTRPDPRDVRRFLGPDNYRPQAVRQEVLTIALCSECKPLRRFAARSVWEKIVGKEIADAYTDQQLHTAGASLIRPLFEVAPEISGPQLSWAHIKLVEARISLAALDIDKLTRNPKYKHKSGMACCSCGVIESAEWSSAALLNGWPTCSDCTGYLTGQFATAKRVAALFKTELLPSSSSVYVPPEALRPFAELDRPPCTERFGYVTPSEKDALRRFLVEISYPRCPKSWREKFAPKKAAPAPVSTPEPVSAVGV